VKIIILGAGQVGASVAESLVSEANDITVVDTDAQLLRALQDRSTCAPSSATLQSLGAAQAGAARRRPADRGDQSDQ
jgi:Trk K+ transport system NAD-binding subunit